MIVHCDVDRTIEYQEFVSGRLRERGNGFVAGTLYRYQSRRSPERKVAEPHSGIKLVCRRAACRVYTSVSRLDVNSHKPNNLPQHSGNDSGVASIKNVLICKIENNGCYRCCAESLHCNPPLFQSVDP